MIYNFNNICLIGVDFLNIIMDSYSCGNRCIKLCLEKFQHDLSFTSTSNNI